MLHTFSALGAASVVLERAGVRRVSPAPGISPAVKRAGRTADVAGMGARVLVPPARMDREVVSPELVLVDPALARVERARLFVPDPTLSRPRAVSAASADLNIEELRKLSGTASLDRGSDGARRARRRSWPLLTGVAAATVVALLFLDVRVKVGETPAAAEGQAQTEVIEPVAASPRRKAAQPADPQHRTKPKAATRPRSGTERPSSRVPAPRRFAWAPVEGADGYHIELFRGAERIFAGDSTGPQLTVPGRWTHDGERRSLTPGRYQWYVWPRSSGVRAPKAVVQATLIVS